MLILLALTEEDSRTDVRLYVALAAIFLLSLAFLKFLFDLVAGRQTPSRVLLTARGVYYHAGAREDEVFVPWGSIHAVEPWHGRRDARIAVAVHGRPGTVERLSSGVLLASRVGRLFRMHGDPGELGKDVIFVRAQQLAVDPALAYYAISYYWYRPDARAELSTEAGLRRIRSGDLMVWFPAERAMVLDAVRALADNQSHELVAVPHDRHAQLATRGDGRERSGQLERLPLGSHSDDLVIHMKNLFDETKVLPDPTGPTRRVVEGAHTSRSIGLLFVDELSALRRLGIALDPLVRDLGARPSWHYRADPRWGDVVIQAERAAQVMEAHGSG